MMAARGDRYSRLVTMLKVLLPVSALGLLSTLFFFSGEVDPSQSIPFAELNVAQLAEEQRGSAPYFAGVTNEGVASTLTGETAIPDQNTPGKFTLESMSARLETEDARVLNATAATALVDSEAERTLLQGNTELTTTDGIRIVTPGIEIAMASGDLETLGALEATGPFGKVTADKMLMPRPGPDLPHSIVFQGNVLMLYEDQSE